MMLSLILAVVYNAYSAALKDHGFEVPWRACLSPAMRGSRDAKRVAKLTAAQQLKTGVDHVWTVCDADVKPDPAVADAFDFTCNNTEMGPISSAIQNQCFASSINGTMDSDYYDCFTSDSWWVPPAMVYSLAATIDTKKGLFCACYTSLIDVVKPYFNIGKWVSIGVTVYFWFVFIGCLFLCCCARTRDEDSYAKSASSNYWARP